MGGRNSQLEPNLQRKQRLKPLAKVRSAETLTWLGFDRVRPNGMFFRGNFLKSAHWIVLQRPVEPAALIGPFLQTGPLTIQIQGEA